MRCLYFARRYIVSTALVSLLCLTTCNCLTSAQRPRVLSMKRTCPDMVPMYIIGVSLWLGSSAPASAAFSDRFLVPGAELLRLDGGTPFATTTTGNMFAPKSPAQKRALESLKQQRRFQDERLALCEDRGVFWENCFMYGVGGVVELPLQQQQPQQPTLTKGESNALPEKDNVSRRHPPTW
mmetsp:Transcript_14747/g.28029  ORF Transcript_14747/g.28029 Transcript_14747/m.28029 type:complete len:181 (-) Transcript_14747:214-756(-)|eukprot:scaffold19245_cov199-Amphora_coffeaeformis.AAC.7